MPHVTLKSIANNPDIKEGMTRQAIDAAISRHADTELLYDKPYEDNKRIRVSGPFTVESLSPHRVLATDEERPSAEREGQRDSAVQFEQMILDNLRKAASRTRSRRNASSSRASSRIRANGFKPPASTPTPTRNHGGSPSRSVPSTAPSGRSR